MACPNLNHRRTRTTVRYCPSCGDIVNDEVPKKTCPATEHREARRDGSAYCVYCGSNLRTDPSSQPG